MVDYVRLEATAQRLIAANGKAVTLVRAGAPTGPEWDPQPGPDTEHAAIMVETGYSLAYRSETLIQAGDKLGLISTDLDIAPAMSDKIKIDGDTYEFIDLQPLNPGGTTLLYQFQARK
ncbi:hypothetical protein GCM10011348_45840 [Marinobacterium nitratireducens]|uniref:Phage protein n=1 Tax=Marinobacterium nitratireducens TaxID=518897 RepID=A0A917ZSL5_9GAMM|nr:hypothetical protein [Marinobacterium nitratireducens]GGO89034.1 hypothetical protein GCM10011348_45840 [Marinobacterium nitratireducens]